jgi:hypothetical protein
MDPDPDPPFYLNADPNPVLTSHLYAEPDPGPVPYQVMRIGHHWSTDPPQLHFEPLHAFIVSVHGPLWFNFQPPKLLNFDFDADPDPAFESGAVPDPVFYSYADLDSQNDADPCGYGSGCTTLLPVYCSYSLEM